MPKYSQSSPKAPCSIASRDRDQAELEHVPLGVRLRARVEEQPAALAIGELGGGRRADRRDRVLEGDRLALARLASPAAKTPKPWAAK